MDILNKKIEQYVFSHTQKESSLLTELEKETYQKMELPQMLTGRIEGRFLKMLVQLTNTKNILEIGMFTGYSALSMAEGLPPDGHIITCEVDPRAKEIAEKYFSKSPHGKMIEIRMGPALLTLKTLTQTFDLVFIDADKENYLEYYEIVLSKLKSGGVIIIDNALWGGRVLKPEDKETKTIDDLNKHIAKDDRVENVLLAIRDGINLIRKK